MKDFQLGSDTKLLFIMRMISGSMYTVHGVKGETHDATLYLETEKADHRILGVFCNIGI